MRLCGKGAIATGWALLAAGALLAACSFPADYDGTSFRCARDAPGECPEGYSCRTGVCVKPSGPDNQDGGDGGAGAEADAAPGQDASPLCRNATSFEDDFSTDQGWDTFSIDPCAIDFTGGQILLANLEGSAIDECAARSRQLYRLDGRTWIQAVVPGDGLPAPGFGIQIGDQTLLFSREEAGLVFVMRERDLVDVFDGTNFVASEQVFWGIRLKPNSDVILFETSADGLGWTTQTEFRPRADARVTCIQYEISIFGPAPSPVPVAFDNLNILP